MFGFTTQQSVSMKHMKNMNTGRKTVVVDMLLPMAISTHQGFEAGNGTEWSY